MSHGGGSELGLPPVLLHVVGLLLCPGFSELIELLFGHLNFAPRFFNQFRSLACSEVTCELGHDCDCLTAFLGSQGDGPAASGSLSCLEGVMGLLMILHLRLFTSSMIRVKAKWVLYSQSLC